VGFSARWAIARGFTIWSDPTSVAFGGPKKRRPAPSFQP
jgi:hypothetical protein